MVSKETPSRSLHRSKNVFMDNFKIRWNSINAIALIVKHKVYNSSVRREICFCFFNSVWAIAWTKFTLQRKTNLWRNELQRRKLSGVGIFGCSVAVAHCKICSCSSLWLLYCCCTLLNLVMPTAYCKKNVVISKRREQEIVREEFLWICYEREQRTQSAIRMGVRMNSLVGRWCWWRRKKTNFKSSLSLCCLAQVAIWFLTSN